MGDQKIDPELKVLISELLFELRASLTGTVGYCEIAMEKLNPASPAHSDVATALKLAESSRKIFLEFDRDWQQRWLGIVR
jgi:hypothetical protein